MKKGNRREILEGLVDDEKMRAFCKAVEEVVRPGDIVLDCSPGAGILSVIAAREGGLVMATEKDKEVMDMAARNIKAGNARVTLMKEDVASYAGPRPDIVIVDMIDTLLLNSDLPRVMNALNAKGALASYTKFIPSCITNFVELATFNFDFYDVQVPMAMPASLACERHIDSLSLADVCSQAVFGSKLPAKCSYEGKHVVNAKGWLNSLRFSSVINLTQDAALGTTSGKFLVPVYVPIEEMYVKPGDVVNVKAEWHYGGGLPSLKASICLRNNIENDCGCCTKE